MPNLKTLGLPLALALLSAQPLATAAEEKNTDGNKSPAAVTAEDVKEIKDRLDAITKSLGGVEQLRKDFDTLRRDIDNMGFTLRLAQEKNKSDIELLRDQLFARLGRMEDQVKAQMSRADGMAEELAALRKKLADGGSRVAARIPLDTGTVRLRNTFVQPVSIVVNGRSYRVEVGETLTLDPQPAGTFTYEVLGIQAPQTRPLAAGERVTINVYPIP
jgi:hypothetical protein